MAVPLEQERKFLENQKADLIKSHLGKFVVIKDSTLVGVYDDAETAVNEGAKQFPGESFLVQPISDQDDQIEIPALTLGLMEW